MFTRENLARLHELTDKVNAAKDEASELLRTAQDRFGHVKHKLTRQGKEVEIKEKTLWDEVFYLGVQSDAGKVLERAHPEVFEAYKRQNETADELKKFCIVEFGLDYTQMTLSGYMKMTESLLTLMLDERLGKIGEQK